MPKPLNWSSATKHLRAVDPILAKVIAAAGPCKLEPRTDYFLTLCKSIYSQQVSTAVAKVLFARFQDLFPRRRPTPKLVLTLTDDQFAPAGLSRQKRAYIRDLASHFHTNKIPTRRFSAMSDEEIIESLTAVHGIGRWTAEMFLIFVLNRPNVWPVDDFGIRKAVANLYNIQPKKPRDLLPFADHWKPWRSVATWYLWRSLDQKI